MTSYGDLWIPILLNLNFPFDGVLGGNLKSGIIRQTERKFFMNDRAFTEKCTAVKMKS